MERQWPLPIRATATATAGVCAELPGFACSCFFGDLFAEEALRPEYQYQEQHQERVRILIGDRYVKSGETFDDPDEQASHDRTFDIAETADDRGGERLERDVGSHADGHKQHRADQYA